MKIQNIITKARDVVPIVFLYLSLAQIYVCYGKLSENHQNCNDPGTKFWRDDFEQKFNERIKFSLNKKKAKNVILMVGDGMGVSTVTAARTYIGGMGQDSNTKTCAGDYKLSMDTQFEATALSKTYSLNTHTPDSASTATALATGRKTHYFSLGHPHLEKTSRDQVPNIAKIAKSQGKKVGLITTTQIIHATPAAFYTHTNDRWNYSSVVDQFVCALSSQAGYVDLALGGGMKILDNETYYKYVDPKKFRFNEKFVNIPSLEEIRNPEKFPVNKNMDKNKDKDIVGIYADKHMPYVDERDPKIHPSLPEMVKFGLTKLSEKSKIDPKNPDSGIFVMIEAGRIDHAHHKNMAKRSLEETKEFDETIKTVINYFKEKNELDETLIILTADHSHQFTMGNYQTRNLTLFSSILDENMKSFAEQERVISWGGNKENNESHILPLNYITGPAGSLYSKVRNETEYLKFQNDVENGDIEGFSVKMPSEIKTVTSAHGGEDVPIFARGPWSFLFSGVVEQTFIFYVMEKAILGGDSGPLEGPSDKSGSEADEKRSLMYYIPIVTIVLLSVQTMLIVHLWLKYRKIRGKVRPKNNSDDSINVAYISEKTQV
jgi:alkaline phosphatase